MSKKNYSQIPVSCRYHPYVLKELDWFAAKTNQTASAVLRNALNLFLSRELNKVKGNASV